MKIDAQYLLEHPFPISVVTGVVNGLIIKLRNKNIDVRTATTLAAVQGMSEAILVMYERPEDRGPILKDMSLLQVGALSSAGLLIGLLPFMFWKTQAAAKLEPLPALPIPEPEPTLVPASASGLGFYPAARSRKKPRRRK